MAYQNLNKLFVRVPANTSAEQIAAIISTTSKTYSNKIYFIEDKN